MLAICPKCGLLMRVFPSNTQCRHCSEAAAAEARAKMREAEAARLAWERLGEPEPEPKPESEQPRWKQNQELDSHPNAYIMGGKNE